MAGGSRCTGGCRRAGLWLVPKSIATDSWGDPGDLFPSLGPRWPICKKGQLRLSLKLQKAGAHLHQQFQGEISTNWSVESSDFKISS